VLQPDAASEISRYFLGRLVPVSLVRPGLLRFAPWPPDLAFQLIHADDLADALARILERRAGGPFNLADDPVVDRDSFRDTFEGVGPGIPSRFLRPAVTATWQAHLQPVDAGWLDLAVGIPLMSTDRARTELGWQPTHEAGQTLREFVAALARREGAAGPLLFPRRLFGRTLRSRSSTG
jgi:nucleoside-diphosphate-sugar epimerase